MSNLYWLEPGWTNACCGQCGAKIWPEGDPDWGLCWPCMSRKVESEQADKQAYEKAMNEQYAADMNEMHAIEMLEDGVLEGHA